MQTQESIVCPNCRSTDTRPSSYKKWEDLLHLFEEAWRCRNCRLRFYARESLTGSSASMSRPRHTHRHHRSFIARTHILEFGIVIAAFVVLIFVFGYFILPSRG